MKKIIIFVLLFLVIVASCLADGLNPYIAGSSTGEPDTGPWNLGNTTDWDGAMGAIAGYSHCNPHTTGSGQSGDLNDGYIYVYTNTGTNHAKLAVFDKDGSYPGSRVGNELTFTITTTGTMSQSFTSGTLTANTDYYVCVITDSNDVKIGYNAGGAWYDVYDWDDGYADGIESPYTSTSSTDADFSIYVTFGGE